MSQLTIKNWESFQINEVFDFYRGKRLKSIDRVEGWVEYYSASQFNNGMTDKISNPLFTDSNKIIFTSFGDCFYVANEFTASDEVIILSPKQRKLDTYIAFFLVSVLRQLKWKYSFGRKAFTNRLQNEFIKLPTNDQRSIDWDIMSQYIKDKLKYIQYKQGTKIQKTGLLNKAKCREFKITDLFTVRGSKKSFTKHDVVAGEYLYITTSNKNNGVSGTSSIFTEEGNVISFDSATEGKCFYQPDKFIGSDHVEILEPKNFQLNKYLGMYFATILNLELFRYSFGRKRAQKRMVVDTIYLPYYLDQNKKPQPDLEFMENYIKHLPYSKYI